MPPNILFILIDDLGARDLGCTGSSFYETPRLDAFFASGLRFDQAYAACPVCSPTRAAILTGKYPGRLGLTQFIGGNNDGRLLDVPYLHYLPREERSLATSLREGGYQTWHVGKWHLGGEEFYPEHHGFEVNLGGCHWGMPKNGYFAPWGIPTLDEQPDGTELTEHLTDRAIELLRGRDRSQPFFLNMSHYTVHTPIQAPAELVAKYEAKARRLGLDRLDPHIEGPDTYPYEGRRGRPILRRLVQSDPTYAAMIEHMDTQVGRLLDTLDELGLADDTIVVFTSDNGGLHCHDYGPTCNLPLAEGKGWMEEGGTRVAQCLRWPGVTAPGAHSAVPVTSTDFYPTLLTAAGLPAMPEQHPDGCDLGGVLRGGALERDALFWHYPHYSNCGNLPSTSMVSGCGRWKLIEEFEDFTVRLYDLRNDPGEVVELSQAQPGRTAEMRARMHAWRQEIEATMPEPNPRWDPSPNNATV